MFNRRGPHVIRLSVGAIFIAQLLLSSLSLVAAPSRTDRLDMICAPKGALTSAMRAASQEIESLFHHETAHKNFCALCHAPSTAAAPTRSDVAVACMKAPSDDLGIATLEPDLVTYGPPIGGRAPPLT